MRDREIEIIVLYYGEVERSSSGRGRRSNWDEIYEDDGEDDLRQPIQFKEEKILRQI